jgi:hypothetical protein
MLAAIYLKTPERTIRENPEISLYQSEQSDCLQ